MRDDAIPMEEPGARLRDARLRSEMTLRDVARLIGVSPSFLSQIENGKSRPSVGTLFALARRLDVSIDELYDTGAAPAEYGPLVAGWGPNGDRNPANAWRPNEFANRISVAHPTHRARLRIADGITWERLAATPDRGVNFMKITYDPGAVSNTGGVPVGHEGFEYGYVLTGTAEVTVGEEVFTLRAHDSLGFDSQIPHLLRNPGGEPFVGVWVVHGPRHRAHASRRQE